MEINNCIILNLRGTTFEIDENQLGKFPGKSPFLTEMEEKFSVKIKNVSDLKKCLNTLTYINRNPMVLNSILDYFQNNELHVPHNMCIPLVNKELLYWGFTDSDLAICCLDRVLQERENTLTSQEVSKQWDQLESKVGFI